MKNNKKMGYIILITTLVVLIIERISNIFSSLLGKVACGELYLKEIDGVLSELSCGFDFDMYISSVLIIMFLIGFIFIYLGTSKNK